MPANDNSVTVKIVGDASLVAPAVDEAGASFAELKPILASISAQMTAMASTMSAAFSEGAAGSKALAAGLEQTKVAAAGASTKIGEMSERLHFGGLSVGIFEKAFAPLAAIVATVFAVDKVGEFINKMAEGAEKVVHLSQEFGMSVGEVQQLQGVAAATGVPIDALTKGLAMLDRNMANAAMGSKNTKQAMDAVGVSMNDGRSQMEKLEVVADKFKNMDDGPKKIALAMQLFGRSGKELIPVLDLGADGIRQLNEKMDEYGVRNEAAVQAGKHLAENVNETKLGFKGVENVLMQALAPAFTTIVEGVNELIQAFVQSYQQGGIVAVIFTTIGDIIQVVTAVVEALGSIFKEIWSVIVTVVKDIWHNIEQAFGIQIPKNVTSSKAVMMALKDVIEIVKNGILLFVDSAAPAIEALGVTIKTFGQVAYDALHLDWGDIKSDWQAGMNDVADIVHRAAGKIEADAKAMSMAILRATYSYMGASNPYDFSGIGKKSGLDLPKAGGDGDYNPTGPTKKGKKGKKPKDDIVQQFSEELQAKKDAWDEEQIAQDTAQAYSLQSIADYWAKAKNLTGLSAKDKAEIENKYVKAEQAVQKQAEDEKLAAMKREIEADGTNYKKKLADLAAYVAETKRFYGAKSKEADAAEKEASDAAKKAAADSKKAWEEYYKTVETLAKGRIADEDAEAKFEVEMGLKSKGQLLGQERDFQNQLYLIEVQALQRKLALLDPTRDKAEYDKTSAQIEILEQQHQNKLNEIDRQATLQRTQIERNAIQSISQSWAQAIGQMVTLQASFSATVKSIWQTVQQTIAQAITSILEGILEKTIANLLGINAQSKTSGMIQISDNAAVAASAAFAAVAGIPIVGPAMAPEAATAAYGGAMGWIGALGAEGGDWNVREGPYSLHQGEMVLPRWAAEGIRGMIGGHSPANFNAPNAVNDSGGHTFNFYGPTNPAQMKQWFLEHNQAVGESVRHYVRQGGNTSAARR